MSSSFGLTKTIVVSQIKKLPESWKSRLRELSLGPYDGSMYRWSFHDGSTYAAVCLTGKDIIGWGCLTYQEDKYPIVGLYVSKEYRGCGIAEDILVQMLTVLNPKSKVILAVKESYPKYPIILNRLGYLYQDWE